MTHVDRSPTHSVAFRFRTDPLDHKAEEAIDQIEIRARFASIYKINKLPCDGNAGAKNTTRQDGECNLNCAHECFSLINIRTFDEVIYLRVADDNRNKVKVTARVWITRGPLGPGRLVTLDTQHFALS